MAAEKGSAFLLKVGNGGSPPSYATIGGMRTTQLSVNGEAVNVTSKDSEGWLVAEGAVDDWAGKNDSLATWTAGGWRFTAPVPGMTAWDKAAGCWLHWSGLAWVAGWPVQALMIDNLQVVGARQPEVPSPSGGTTIDSEARAAIDLLIVTLKTHGLID